LRIKSFTVYRAPFTVLAVLILFVMFIEANVSGPILVEKESYRNNKKAKS
jgi:hypothetical protein